MKLLINGEEKDFNCKTVLDLINTLKLEKDMVAVELNRNIVHRQNFDNAELKNDDKIEIVTVVGGG